jgi:hypothetical protein
LVEKQTTQSPDGEYTGKVKRYAHPVQEQRGEQTAGNDRTGIVWALLG